MKAPILSDGRTGSCRSGRPPAGHAYHLLVARLDAALAFDSPNRAKLLAPGRRFDSTPPLSKRYIPMHKRLDDFLYPVLYNDFGSAPAALRACTKTVEAAQDDLVPFPPSTTELSTRGR